MRYTCILYLYIYSEIYLYFQWYVCIIFYKFLPRCQYIYCIFVQVVHRDVSKLSEMFLRIFTEIIVYLFRLLVEIFVYSMRCCLFFYTNVYWYVFEFVQVVHRDVCRLSEMVVRWRRGTHSKASQKALVWSLI